MCKLENGKPKRVSRKNGKSCLSRVMVMFVSSDYYENILAKAIRCCRKFKNVSVLKNIIKLQQKDCCILWIRGLIDEFLAWYISGVARCNLTFSLESLSFFSITLLRMF